MLQIRLSKTSASDGSVGVKQSPAETVTVACPDHLVLADLPVAKGIGAPSTGSLVRNVGRRSRFQLGERVHFCVRCDFPIAIYGRLAADTEAARGQRGSARIRIQAFKNLRVLVAKPFQTSSKPH